MIKLITFNVKKKDIKTVERIRDFFGENTEILDVFSFQPEFKPGDTLLIFGNKAYRQLNNITECKAVVLPDVHKLDAELGDTNERKYVFKVIKEIKEKQSVVNNEDINTDNGVRKIQVDNIQEFSIAEILENFKQNIEKNGDYHWMIQLKDGQQMRVSSKFTNDFKGINITFDELAQLKMAIDTLDIQEIEIVGSFDNQKRD